MALTNPTVSIEIEKRKLSRRGPRSVLPERPAKLIVGCSIILVLVVFAIVAPFFAGSPTFIRPIGATPPSAEFWLGTNGKGQDVFAQIAEATGNSLIIGALVGLLALALSAVFGIVGSYYGGFADESISLFTNIMLVIPGLPLLIIISAYVEDRGMMVTVLILAFTGWAGGARVLRSVTLSLRSRDYVLASRLGAEPTWRILGVEILPNLLPILATQFIFGVIYAILAEAGLAFLGLGVSDQYTLGMILADAQMGSALRIGAWWWFVPPGLIIAALGAGLSLINFALDEIVNPRLRVPRPPKRALEKAATTATDEKIDTPQNAEMLDSEVVR